MVGYYSTGEDLAIARMEQMAMREREIAAAGLATAATKRAAMYVRKPPTERRHTDTRLQSA